jgi:glutathione S-transferase
MSDLILHHYDTSPFSEKVRLVFGMKGLTWRSVVIPNVAPKPDLTPLTGGYRRTPVMQVGADVFIDSQLMLAEIDRRFPEPPLRRGGLDFAVNLWADRLFFQTTVPIIFGAIGHMVPETFIKDREQLSGRPFDTAGMKAVAEPLKGQWRAQAAWIERHLEVSGDWTTGDTPALCDASVYMNFWFLKSFLPQAFEPLTAGFQRLPAWLDRVAALGHGERVELTGPEALDIARAAEPESAPPHDSLDPLGLDPGAAVWVSADDYGRDRISGALVAANPDRIVIRREDPRVGTVHLHFPRAGYLAGPA